MVPALLKPIDWEKVRAGEHKLYVFTDASIAGVGAHINSGPDRVSSMPYRFYSAKFNPAQVNYDTTNQELLAVVSAVKQFEQHLVGWKLVIVSDHEPLKMFWTTAPTLTRRHIRMYNELSHFDFEMEFIPGKDNVIADSLSRVWECDDLVASDSDFIHEPDLNCLFFDSIPPSSASLAAFAAGSPSIQSLATLSPIPLWTTRRKCRIWMTDQITAMTSGSKGWRSGTRIARGVSWDGRAFLTRSCGRDWAMERRLGRDWRQARWVRGVFHADARGGQLTRGRSRSRSP
jgi:hypothetical protein